MRKVRNGVIWYFMFSKRLLHKFSFVVLMCLIPVVIPLTNVALSDDAGVIRVVLCCEDNDPISKNAIKRLMDADGIISYTVCNSRSEAESKVKAFDADAAWIFVNNMTDAIEDYISNNSDTQLVNIIQREETVPLKIARELLHGALYDDIAFAVYKNFVKAEVPDGGDISDDDFYFYFSKTAKRGEIIRTERLNSEIPPMKTNYLTAPLRGILVLMIMLCTLAAAIYFLKDSAEGKFDWLPPMKRVFPAFGSCLSASVFSSIAVFFALQLSGLSTYLLRDILALLLYALCTTGFCLNMCIIFRSPGKLGASIPGIIILTLVLSPVFFNGTELKFIRLCLPAYYYLQATYNNSYFVYMVYYIVGSYGLAFVLNIILNGNRSRKYMMRSK